MKNFLIKIIRTEIFKKKISICFSQAAFIFGEFTLDFAQPFL